MKLLFSILLLVFSPMIMFAQQAQSDIIQTTDSRTIQALIVEIDLQVVRYRLASHPEGPIHTIRKTDIMTITYRDGSVVVFNTPQHLQFRDDLARAERLRANGLVWMYVGAGVMALGAGLDWWIGTLYHPNNPRSDFDRVIGPMVIVAGGVMVIGGGIAVLAGISQRDRARNALLTHTLFETPNSQLNLGLNPNSIGLTLKF